MSTSADLDIATTYFQHPICVRCGRRIASPNEAARSKEPFRPFRLEHKDGCPEPPKEAA